MRDIFYNWLAVAIASAVCFGASMARAIYSNIDVFSLMASGGICLITTVCAVKRYRKDTRAGAKP